MPSGNNESAGGGQQRQHEEHVPELKQCPHCGESSLFWNHRDSTYECLNIKCKARLIVAGMPMKSTQTESRVSEAPHAVQKLRHGIRALAVLLILTAITAIILGASWYLTDNNLSQANALLSNTYGQLDYQRQETSKYLKLSSDYSTRLEQKEQQVNAANLEITQTQTELKQKTQELSAATSQISAVKAELKTAESQYADASLKLKTADTQLLQYSNEIQNKKKELELYKQTYGSVVASGIRPPYQRADIVNQSNATDPSYAQLQAFLLADKTDSKDYVTGVYMCGDYSRDVHNNAERNGIRAGWVAILFQGEEIGHACNVFKTTDRGLVFIDCTGLRAVDYGPSNCDKIVSVKLGKTYVPMSMFPEVFWEVAWGSFGTILDVQIYW